MTIAAPLPGGVTLDIVFPGGARERRRIGATPLRLSRRVVVAPGSSSVAFAVDGALPFGVSTTTPAFVVTNQRLTDRRLLAGGRPAAAAVPAAGLAGPTCSELYADSAASHLTRQPTGE
jgi:hypothetical protein